MTDYVPSVETQMIVAMRHHKGHHEDCETCIARSVAAADQQERIMRSIEAEQVRIIKQLLQKKHGETK